MPAKVREAGRRQPKAAWETGVLLDRLGDAGESDQAQRPGGEPGREADLDQIFAALCRKRTYGRVGAPRGSPSRLRRAPQRRDLGGLLSRARLVLDLPAIWAYSPLERGEQWIFDRCSTGVTPLRGRAF